MTTLQRVTYKTWFTLSGVALPMSALAAGDFGGTDDITESGIKKGSSYDIRGSILKILAWVLNFLALLAIIYIIVAGIRLIVSQGEDEQKGKAKKTIIYVIVGLIVIMFARIIIGFVTKEVPNFVN